MTQNTKICVIKIFSSESELFNGNGMTIRWVLLTTARSASNKPISGQRNKDLEKRM
jgi:hypothetical protein